MDSKTGPNSNNPWASYMQSGAEQLPPGTQDNAGLPTATAGLPWYNEATGFPESQHMGSYEHRTPTPFRYRHPQFYNQPNPRPNGDLGVNYPNQSFPSTQNPWRPPLASLIGTTTSDDASMNDAFMNQALDFTNHPPASNSAQHRLRRPVAVPQVAAGLGMPFARAYSPVLQDRDISVNEFLEFIDNLNVVSTGSPPLQILDIAGSVVGMVPHHIPQLVGGAINVTAKLGTAGISKGRSTMFMKKANSDFFTPRGLKVEFITGRALKVKLGLPLDAHLVTPLSESNGLNAQERRIRALQDYISPLAFDVPQPSEQTNTLEKMSAWKVQKQAEQSEKKALKDREKALKKENTAGGDSKAERDFEKKLAKIDKEKEKAQREYEKELRKGGERKALREFEREMQKLDREAEKAGKELEKESSKSRKDASKDDKEVKQADKVLWILVQDA
jgi:hypothetical protein